jgi:hypothetical protein
MKRTAAVCLFALFALIAVPLDAADWVVGAEAFSVPRNAAQPVTAASRVIPQIMLDYFETNIARTIFTDELTERRYHELLTRRQALYLELSAAVQRRDKLIFDSSAGKKSSLKTEEKTIAATKQKIQENLTETQKLLGGTVIKNDEVHEEKIKLWKNDYKQLFALSADKKYEAALDAEKINGLVTGEMRLVGEYMAVTAVLHVYPGGKTAASITEVGKLSESAEIARRLAFSLLPHLVRTLPIRISFDILPENVRKNVTVYVDEMVYTSIPDEITLQGGIHTVGIEAQGYKRESFTTDFAGDKTYVVHAQLNEEIIETIALSLKNQIKGTFYINSFEAKPDKTKSGASIVVEAKNSTVFGQFVHSNGTSSYFYISPVDSTQRVMGGVRFSTTAQAVTINPQNVDIGKKIETSRKIMYFSYTAAMISLPVLFYAIGEYTQYNNGSILAYNRGDLARSEELRQEAEKWGTIQNVTIAVSATLTANFVVQLIFYLVQANKVLPEKAKAN